MMQLSTMWFGALLFTGCGDAQGSGQSASTGPGCIAASSDDETCSEPPQAPSDGTTAVLGGPLAPCAPPTGFYRDGSCRTGPEDRGNHAVCAVMTDAFLRATRDAGNDLITPRPDLRFPGLSAGDRWCLCASRWEDARRDGVAPEVVLEATAASALRSTTEAHLVDHGTYLGRRFAHTMGVGGAPWLTRPERVEEEDPATLHEQLGVEPGDTVCDVGAGNGYHSLLLADRVGPEGRVVATDIQEGMLERLRARATQAGFDNVRTVLSTQDDAKLPANTCDLVLMVDVYHELSNPVAMLADIRGALTEKGRVALVEYRAEDPTVPIKPLHKMSVAQCDQEYQANGFRRVGRYDALPWQHLLFYAPE